MNSEEFKKIREIKGLNQTDFGEKLGLAQSSVSEYETGKTEIPKTVEILVGTLLAEPPAELNPQEEVSDVRIQNMLIQAEKIMRSKSPFATALFHNLDAFVVGFELWEKEKSNRPLKAGHEPER